MAVVRSRAASFFAIPRYDMVVVVTGDDDV
jgi:hypothetical protein